MRTMHCHTQLRYAWYAVTKIIPKIVFVLENIEFINGVLKIKASYVVFSSRIAISYMSKTNIVIQMMIKTNGMHNNAMVTILAVMFMNLYNLRCCGSCLGNRSTVLINNKLYSGATRMFR